MALKGDRQRGRRRLIRRSTEMRINCAFPIRGPLPTFPGTGTGPGTENAREQALLAHPSSRSTLWLVVALTPHPHPHPHPARLPFTNTQPHSQCEARFRPLHFPFSRSSISRSLVSVSLITKRLHRYRKTNTEIITQTHSLSRISYSTDP
jgi:hypothetical protein